jgi:uncharacterized protein YndB with AHSA1/START domain
MSDAKEFIVIRTCDASRERVFAAWSDYDSLKQWWGPTGMQWVTGTLDFQPGGSFHYCMKSPEGYEMWGKFVYGDIAAREKIIFTNSFSDKDGNIVRAPFSSSWPREVKNVMTFEEKNGKTIMTLRGNPVNPTPDEQKTFEAMFDSMQKGFGATFDQLTDYLAKTA